MSSIYDALQRLQHNGDPDKPSLPLTSRGRRPIRPALAAGIAAASVALIVSVALTVVWFSKPEPAAVPAQRPAAPAPLAPPPAPAVQPSQDPALMLAEARELKEQGKFMAAAAIYNRLLALSPERLELYFELGALQTSAGNLDEALVVYDKGLSVHHDEPRLLNNMGTVLLKKGELSSAVGYFEQAQARAPDFVEPVYNLACAYARLKEPAKAIRNLKKASEMHPDVAAWAAGDPDLKSLEGNAEFDALVARQ
ncbi:MAG: tetratricopeptide repeat protein [Deltaproteobacteria bacterium ADurb.Bin510]|nr:MAG: tetratricopeptide repeat protein [Deltaproteobacteria bacterium ADurb.Bin510]